MESEAVVWESESSPQTNPRATQSGEVTSDGRMDGRPDGRMARWAAGPSDGRGWPDGDGWRDVIIDFSIKFIDFSIKFTNFLILKNGKLACIVCKIGKNDKNYHITYICKGEYKKNGEPKLFKPVERLFIADLTSLTLHLNHSPLTFKKPSAFR